VGPSGEPFLPIEVLGKFSNQCLVIVREKIQITYQDWKKVSKGLKQCVWEEMLKRFRYLEGSDLDKFRDHVLAVASKVLRNFWYKLNKEYVEKGRSPCQRYNYVLPEVWERFLQQKETPEAKQKS
jgi:hypothetical protein